MNRIYRLVWSHVASAFIPVAEFTAGHRGKASRAGRRKLLISGALVSGLMPAAALADIDVQWATAYPSYAFPTTPGYNFDQVLTTGTAFTIGAGTGSTNYAAGTALNVLGPMPSMPTPSGNGITGRSVTVLDALPNSPGADGGRIILIVANSNNVQGSAQPPVPVTRNNINQYSYSPSPARPQQDEELNVEVPGLDGSYQVISAYDSATFIPAQDTAVAGMTLPVYNANSARIMNQFGIVSVSNTGGTANINIGADTAGTTPIAAAANTLDLLAKDSTLAQAATTSDFTGPTSAVNWQSDNYIHFRPAAVISSDVQKASAQSTKYSYTLTLPNYVEVLGKTVQAGEKSFAINTAQDIADVNDYLTGQGDYNGKPQIQYWLNAGATVNGDTIDSTVEAQRTYDAIIQGLLAQAESTAINMTYHAWEDRGVHSNNATLGTGNLRIIYADGANATGTVTSTGSLAVDGATAVMEANANAHITNNGAINTWRSSGSSPESVGMKATNSSVVNNGVINAGLFLEKNGANQNVNNAGATAISASGASSVANNGFINVGITDSSTHTATGIKASGTTEVANNAGKSIVITGNSHNVDGHGGAYGVDLSEHASFLNHGNIWIGGTPLTAAGTPTAVNLVGSGDLTAGIYTTSANGVSNSTDGTITLLSGTRNAAGMMASDNQGTVTNDGTILVQGKLTAGSAAANYGMFVQDNVGAATNNGNIQVQGDNNIALNILAMNADASLTSSTTGKITVGSAGDTGGSDANPFTYRNYAVYAEGLDTHAATVDLQSTILLLSAGAIGVHARGNATINLGDASSLTFENSRQIGYYAWGQGATINISKPTITDSGKMGSVLFAVDSGAKFTGSTTGGNYRLTVAGAGSTGVFANGFDDLNDTNASNDVATQITTGNASITVSGDNAVGVRVTGGAKGTISNGAIQLTGDNTTAVAVDGRDYSINGDIGDTPVATQVASDAVIGSAAGQKGITGYDVAYLGNLTLNSGANINLLGDNSTGILLHNGGLATINVGAQPTDTTVSVAGSNNIGVDIQNAGTLTNNGTITVSGVPGSENVGVRVQGSGAVVNQLGNVNATGGKAAVQLTGNGASLTVNGTGNHITAGGDADGVLIDSTGASSFTASNTIIDLTGSGAGINNNASSSNVKLNSVTINAADGPAIRTAVTFSAEGSGNVLNVRGSGSGFAFMKSDGSATTGNLNIGTGYTINGNGANSVGVLAKTSGTVNSGTSITMDANAGAAIDATNASSLTNQGNIQTSSDTGSTILAANTAAFSNSGTINSSSTSNSSSLIVLNGTAASRIIDNTSTGVITSSSETAKLIDATGSANNTVTNSGTLKAASSTAQAVITGSGNDSLTLSGGDTRGELTLGSGKDSFTWNSGLFDGGVTFTGNDGQDSATVGSVDIAKTTHILSEGGTGSTLTFEGTKGSIGSLTADDPETGTNIGTGWSTLTLTGAGTDMRVAKDLTLSAAPVINVNNGAILRTGDSATVDGEATIHNYNIATAGSGAKISFDGSKDQTYSGVISGTGGMERVNGGNTILLGDNTYTGDTLIGVDSELSLGMGGEVGSLSEQTNITDNGILTVNHSDVVTLGGVISGSGDFRQIGAGITRLGGANSYAGSTGVEKGTLLVNGVQTGSGDTTVSGGATLGGVGALGGNVIFTPGTTPGTLTTLTPGDMGTGKFTIGGNLSLANDTTSEFQLGEAYVPGGTYNDLVNVGKNLDLNGDLDVKLADGGTFLPGVYRLYNYGGGLTDNGLNIVALPPTDSKYEVQTNVPQQVNLVLNFLDPTTALQFWDGDAAANHDNDKVDGGFGSWSPLLTSDANKWTQSSGLGNAPWAQHAFAVFQGAGSEVNITPEVINGTLTQVVTSGMQFSSNGYTLNPVNGSELQFVATNAATGLNPANSYTAQGETAANRYFLIRVGDGGAGEDVVTTINANLVQDTDPVGATPALSGDRDSSGNLNVTRLLKTDPGTLVLNGDNRINGGVEVWNGTLQVSKDSSLGNVGTSVTLKNDATLRSGANLTTNRKIFLDKTGGGTLDAYGNTFTPTGIIGGDGNLTIEDTSAGTGAGQLVLNTANTYLGNTLVNGKNGTGTLDVNVNATGAFGKQDSTVTLNDDARVNFRSSANAQTHTFDVDGASLTFNDSASAGQSTIGLTAGTASFTGSSNAGSATINVDNTSRLLMSGSADGGTSVTTNAGTVAFSGNAQAANARIANQSGANVTLADAGSKTSIGSLSGEGTVNLGSKTLSEGNLNLNDTISGLISGVGGGLEKVGTGILTLTADNTFTGATSVMNGVLLINGDQSAATGATSVASNATLGGEGTLGANVTVADNGHLAPGKDLSSVGILTMNNLTLANNAQLDFQFGKSNVQDEKDPLNDLLVVNGDLTLDGKLNIAQTPGGKFDVGVYRVINYSGNLINNGLQFGTVPDAANQLYVQTSVANQVNLVNTSGLVLNFWDGTGGPNGGLKNNGKIDGGDGVWQNSGGNDNWTTDQTDPAGAINAPFSDGAFAVFSGRKGNVTVDNSLGDVLISGAQFTTNGYVINDGVITTNTADTVIRVGDGTALGRLYTATINSQITGSGGIDKTDVGTLVLNGNNSYRGGTTVSGGVLQVSGDQNLGAADTGITLNGGTFRYGAAFDTARAWTVGDNSGTINTNGNDVSLLSAVSGSGGLTKAGDGTLTLTKDSSYSGLTTIRNGTLQLGNGGGTGSVAGNILNLDTLVVNRNNTVDLDGVITGTGDFIQRGSGTTYLNGLNNWSGYTLVENGTLIAGGASRFSAKSSHIVSQNATLDTGGRNQTVANLVNQGTVNLRGGNVGSTLTVNGDYVGMDGTIKIAAQQHSPGVADKLVINGGTATGTTRLDIDVSQLGEPTTGDGIMVVEAKNGATTTAQTTKDAFNIGGDKLIAGAWQYQLYAGNASGAGEDWFLRAGYSPVVPGFDTLPSIVRQADLFVLGTLHQRVGDEQPWRADVPEDQEGRFWARYLTKTVDQHLDDATSSKSHSQYDGMQIGFDLWQNDKWRSGIYTTFMDLDSSVSGNTGMGGGSAYNSTFSSYVGGYATWTDTNGFYVDNVLQYGYHSVDLKSEGSSDTYHPNGNTVTASVEVGKPWQLGDSNWAFEPQAQLVWQWSNFDDVTLNDGVDTHVSTDADSAVIGRLGARLTADYDTNMGKVKPYVRVNFWKELTDGDDAVTYSNGANSHGKTTLKANQQFSATEAAVGATWTVTNDVQAYTEVGKTWDNGDNTNVDADLSASVGMKIRF
ncbi:autotransporter-associated beta strand repeat-containing protein [Scandinavium sp. H11S7]|uniref:autotransporter-associated beta strand repeat-containing protein n=1 Tax=Scandinavium hiltneri TaxID=2926519 RepID=UPI0021657C08|nr:autotransporter-associated beta strand repeat-containing protein [Scandinavium hiltneri]MCS2158122.1 autotransporter-associated beta strand repeat-containing protein [Scandinavium hiltneri]